VNPNPWRVSIVIPVYNGAKTIGPMVEQLVAELGHRYLLEIVLVNDASPDDSEAVCAALFARFPEVVRFYSLARNVGEHNAVMAGLNHATGDYVVIMDDDFQNPVSEVRKMVEAIRAQGTDVVYSWYERKRHSLFRNFGSWINDKAANWTLEKPRDLYLSSFKVMNRFLVNEITKSTSPFPYIDGLILQITGRIGRVQVAHAARQDGRSGYTLKKLIRLWLSMFTNFSILPLRVSMILGFVFSGLALILGVNVVIEKMANPGLPVGYASIVVVVSLLAGIQLILLGMVGEYVGRIFLLLNRKPQFTIRKSWEPNEEKIIEREKIRHG
jgi:undecaprenyl-phosphate 4-deoxy-4-formamido-L-arabinose transferase